MLDITIITAGSAVLGLFLGAFGWSHRTLSSKIDELENLVQNKLSEQEMRTILNDKLETYRVEYAAVSRRIDELQEQQRETNRKLEKLLELIRPG